MEIINKLDDKKFSQIDDLLTFISIYDDKNRTRWFFEMLEANKEKIVGKVCVEIGSGNGLISEKLLQLGAKKVYSIEKNPYLYQLSQKRLSKYPNSVVLNMDALDFEPEEPIDLLVYELFGQMLFDEDLYVLNLLKWRPKYYLPQKAYLKAGLTNIEDFEDEVIDLEFLKLLEGVLVSGLFDEEGLKLEIPVLSYNAGEHLNLETEINLSQYKGNLLYFGIELYDDRVGSCYSGICENWSYVWTYRKTDVFKLWFEKSERGMEVNFQWVE